MSYELTTEAYTQFSKAIVDANGDQATLTTVLSEMEDTFKEAIVNNSGLTKSNEELKAENERLKQSNWKLYLRQTSENPNNTPRQEEKPRVQNTTQFLSDFFKPKGDNNHGNQ